MEGVSDSHSSDFIRELCIAQAHRWESGRLFMILTAYMDESGTHDGSHATIMGAFLGSARQWSAFQRRLDSIRSQYGFRIFHAKDFKAKKGEFVGWSDAKCSGLVSDLVDVLSENLMAGITTEIPRDAYSAHYRTGEPTGKVRLDTEYGLAFRACLSHAVFEAKRRLGHHKKFHATKLHVVLEKGAANSGDAQRVFFEIQDQLEAMGIPLLATFTLAKKEQALPLMVADFLAYAVFTATRDGNISEARGGSGRPKGARLYHANTDADGLARLRADLLSRRKIKAGDKFISLGLLVAENFVPRGTDGGSN